MAAVTIHTDLGLLLLLLSRFSRVQLCATPWTAAHQIPLSLGLSRQEYWSGLPFPYPMHACMLSRFSRPTLDTQNRVCSEDSGLAIWAVLKIP